jgi:hypothetical protein
MYIETVSGSTFMLKFVKLFDLQHLKERREMVAAKRQIVK